MTIAAQTCVRIGSLLLAPVQDAVVAVVDGSCVGGKSWRLQVDVEAAHRDVPYMNPKTVAYFYNPTLKYRWSLKLAFIT